LTPEDSFFRIQAQSNIVDRNVKNALRDIFRSRIACQGVIVGDEVEAIVLGLKLELTSHSSEKIAYMKPAGRLDTRKNSQAVPPCKTTKYRENILASKYQFNARMSRINRRFLARRGRRGSLEQFRNLKPGPKPAQQNFSAAIVSAPA
jgi:hypothetical protein